MSELNLPLIDRLPEVLVTPERFGRVALAPLVKLPLPETARIYNFPGE